MNSSFLKKLLLVLLEMNLTGEVGRFEGEFVLYYKMMMLFPNYRAAETMFEELNESVNFIQNSGKSKPRDSSNKFNEAFVELVTSTIKEFQNKNTKRVNLCKNINIKVF